MRDGELRGIEAETTSTWTRGQGDGGYTAIVNEHEKEISRWRAGENGGGTEEKGTLRQDRDGTCWGTNGGSCSIFCEMLGIGKVF